MTKQNPNTRSDSNPHFDQRVQRERDSARQSHENTLKRLDEQAGGNKGGREQ